MASTQLTFNNRDEHRAWLASQASLPRGFRVGTTQFSFTPGEAPKPARMTLTLIALDQPTSDFAAVFTRNAFPGAPIILGRQRLAESSLGAIIINNKISNVCAPGGSDAAEKISTATAAILGLDSSQILPSSTGIIGWTLPTEAMISALPAAASQLQADSILPAAEGIVTTDLYPKIRSVSLGEGRIVGIAKGAGMTEPNLATMLVYILTDLAVPRDTLRTMLQSAVDQSFNRISIDSDTSTSDTVALISSGTVTSNVSLRAFGDALNEICRDLAEDVVRNGEGVRHVIRTTVTGAKDNEFAHLTGKAVVNAPLFKCAVAGNDPNVGRLVQAIGRFLGNLPDQVDASALRLTMGGHAIFANGVFQLNPTKEIALVEHLKQAELYSSAPTADGVFTPPVDYPTHERCVEIGIEIGSGPGQAIVIGGDLTHEYVTENADYRS
ncbi:MAG: bifunctional ornithine acetyltransferase/N-acetylglutamate synthase [Candidatus Synoicihabitans palmerolidicus]|nr:bifunctional ornithine acetyltransferase/N-acetylglutamate synthase [Candidatus Synoicihabitans palmerolidicus]